MKTLSKKYFILLLYIVYLISNFIIPFSVGVWWDDLQIPTAENSEEVRRVFMNGGQWLMGIYHGFMLDMIGREMLPQFYHIVIFVVTGISLYMAYKILTLFNLPENLVRAISLLVASTPLFTSQIMIIDMMYVYANFFCALGVLLFLLYLKKHIVAFRILAFVSFMCSMLFWQTCFVLIPAFLLFMAIYVQPDKPSFKKQFIKSVSQKLLNWAELILCPVLFWIIRSLYLMPGGVHEGYYAITPERIIKMPIIVIENVYMIARGYLSAIIHLPFTDVSFDVFSIVVILVVVYIVACKTFYSDAKNSSKFEGCLLLVGFFLWVAAIMPTSMLHPGSVSSVNSRYFASTLVPFSIIVVALFSVIKNNSVRKYLLSALVAVNVIINVSLYLSYQRCWIKDSAIMELIKTNELLSKDYTNVLVKDNTKYGMYSSPNCYYHYSGLSMIALNGNSTHFYAEESVVHLIYTALNYKVGVGIEDELKYCCKESRDQSSFQCKLSVNKSKRDLTFIETLRCMFMFFWNKDDFFYKLPDYVRFEVMACNLDFVK